MVLNVVKFLVIFQKGCHLPPKLLVMWTALVYRAAVKMSLAVLSCYGLPRLPLSSLAEF